jgi:hypothetical protein
MTFFFVGDFAWGGAPLLVLWQQERWRRGDRLGGDGDGYGDAAVPWNTSFGSSSGAL